MNITRPESKPRFNTPRVAVSSRLQESDPLQSTEPTIVDYVSRGVGVAGGALQVILKTPRNAIAPFLLPPRQANAEGELDIPTLSNDPALTGPWEVASTLGGAVFMGTAAALTIGGPMAIALGVGIGATLFPFVDNKLADRARADNKAPVFVDGALAKGNAQAEGASGLGAWSDAFTAMSQSSYVEVSEWYSAKVKEKLSP